MHTRKAIMLLALCSSHLCSLVSAEMGMHWWPAGNGAWTGRQEHEVVAFDGALWLIGGGRKDEFPDPEGTVIYYYYLPDVWRSEDGTNWTRANDLPVLPRSAFHSLVHNDKLYLIGAFSHPVTLLSTLDGATWLSGSSSAIQWSCHGMTVFLDRMWAMGTDSGQLQVQVSDDGESWEEVQTEPANMAATCLQGVVNFKGGLVALSIDSAMNWSSEDALNWSLIAGTDLSYPQISATRVLSAADRIWYFSGNGVYSSADAVEWNFVSHIPPYPLGSRTNYAVIEWQDKIWIFGGAVVRSNGTSEELNDIWYTEDTPEEIHRADYDADGAVSLSELLRVIQFFQAGRYQCDGTTEDSYAPGPGWETCYPHSSDYLPQDWRIDLSELLRAVQFYNVGSYHACPDANTEDGYCPGAG